MIMLLKSVAWALAVSKFSYRTAGTSDALRLSRPIRDLSLKEKMTINNGENFVNAVSFVVQKGADIICYARHNFFAMIWIGSKRVKPMLTYRILG